MASSSIVVLQPQAYLLGHDGMPHMKTYENYYQI